MRELKFRGLTEGSGIWEYGLLFKERWCVGYNWCIASEPLYVNRYDELDKYCYEKVQVKTIGQFTGLYTEQGVELYEGDILEFNDFAYDRTGGMHTDTIRRATVIFEQGAFWLDGFLLIDVVTNDPELEVVGNIHEHQELLTTNRAGEKK